MKEIKKPFPTRRQFLTGITSFFAAAFTMTAVSIAAPDKDAEDEDAEDDEAVGADKSVLVVEDFRLDQLGDIALVLLESGPGGGLEDRAERLERGFGDIA